MNRTTIDRILCFVVGHQWHHTTRASLLDLPLKWEEHRDCQRCGRHQVQKIFPVFQGGWQ